MTATHKCPQGHESADADFCSDCGSQIAAAAAAPAQGPADPASVAASAPAEDCPKCTEVRDGAAQFCGVCGYDFINKTGGEVPPADPVVAAGPPTVLPKAPAAVPSPSAARIDVEVVVAGGRARKHSLFDEESLIGRPNNKAVLSLVIDGDEGISRRQMIITRHADKATLRDLDSANGTEVERAGVRTPVAQGEERELAAGDKIYIGEHTVVTVVSINL
jgi:hypothetical protein